MKLGDLRLYLRINQKGLIFFIKFTVKTFYLVYSSNNKKYCILTAQ